jgi:hypothetical protein
MKIARGLWMLGAIAAAVPAHAGWVMSQTLTQVGSGDYAGEYVWFSTTQAASNPANCPSSDIYVLRTVPKNALAILLAAKVSGSPIRLYVVPTACDSATGRPLVSEVGIQ